ncbi:pseudouridine synthase [Terfezia claveryi]|nr:pseudouridine synthase [Terfezia claveryi]
MASPSTRTGALSPPPAKRLRLDSPSLAISASTTTEVPAPGQNDVSDSTSLELNVGITEYLNPTLAGFTGVLKQRYTDFLVNEITPEGEVVHLKSLDVPRRDGKEKGRQENAEMNGGEAKAEKVEEALEKNGSESEVSELVPVLKPSTETTVEAIPAPSISLEDHAELFALIGKEALTSLLALYATLPGTPGPQTKHPPILTPKIDSKDSRTSLHRAMRRIFSGKFDTTTLEGAGNEGVISITVSRNAGHTSRGGRPERGGRGGKRGGRDGGRGGGDRGEKQDPYSNGQYLHFTLHKENRDTMDVVNMLGRILNLPRQLQQKTFAFAGTKDKRAVTAQRVSGFKINLERLAGANWPSTGVGGRGGRGGSRVGRGGGGGFGGAATFGLPRGCKVGDFEWKTTGLELGDLKGNEFLITLRDVTPTNTTAGEWASLTIEEHESRLREIVGSAMDGLEKNGFINYYGLQRFGTFARGTHDVGIKMLRMDWKGAVDEIMHFDTSLTSLPDEAEAEKLQVSRDEFDRARALKIFSETVSNPSIDDYGKKLQYALSILPRKFLAENAIINAAKDRVGGGTKIDWLQCLMRIPRGLRLMYIHSYQSFVWNHVVSERVRKFGREGVVEGDLVLVDGIASRGKVDEDVEMEDDTVDQDGEPIVRDTSTRFQSPSAKLTKEEGANCGGFQRARPLTKEEVESGRYSICDIVLPTPGYDIEFPGNELKEVYVELMKKDGLDPMQMRRTVREVSLSGAYRKVIGRVLGPVQWEVKRVKGVEQCVATDLEKLMEEKRAKRELKVSEERKDGQEDKMEIEGDGMQTVAVKEGEGEKSEVPEGPVKLAVLLKMQLGTSMYATMALREVMKAGGVQSYQPEFGHGHGQGR